WDSHSPLLQQTRVSAVTSDRVVVMDESREKSGQRIKSIRPDANHRFALCKCAQFLFVYRMNHFGFSVIAFDLPRPGYFSTSCQTPFQSSLGGFRRKT